MVESLLEEAPGRAGPPINPTHSDAAPGPASCVLQCTDPQGPHCNHPGWRLIAES